MNTRISSEVIEATYGNRDRYLKVCERNLAIRSRETFRKYVKTQRRLGIELMSEPRWQAAQAAQLANLRANIEANQHEPF